MWHPSRCCLDCCPDHTVDLMILPETPVARSIHTLMEYGSGVVTEGFWLIAVSVVTIDMEKP